MVSNCFQEELEKTEACNAFLSTEEYLLVEEALSSLSDDHIEDVNLAIRRFKDLDLLGKAIARFPSIKESQILRGQERNGTTLAASLAQFSNPSRVLHTPTRVVASRAFLVAKSHAFSLLSILVGQHHPIQKKIQNIIFSVSCALMAEDVYLSCLDDPCFPYDKKERLANDLVHLWDHGIDPRSSEHVPSLQALWRARNETAPAFGTLDGSSELVRISLELDDDWQEFLLAHLKYDETKFALEEFLFALSYEEIQQLRRRLVKYGICAIDYADVRNYLGTEPAYGEYTGHLSDGDPRSIYDFYAERRDAAHYRARLKAPGPHKTLEELYLIFKIFQE
ncbi:MAG: hypothetical protein SNJ56_02875 [Termitinemataceae bacterium]